MIIIVALSFLCFFSGLVAAHGRYSTCVPAHQIYFKNHCNTDVNVTIRYEELSQNQRKTWKVLCDLEVAAREGDFLSLNGRRILTEYGGVWWRATNGRRTWSERGVSYDVRCPSTCRLPPPRCTYSLGWGNRIDADGDIRMSVWCGRPRPGGGARPVRDSVDGTNSTNTNENDHDSLRGTTLPPPTSDGVPPPTEEEPEQSFTNSTDFAYLRLNNYDEEWDEHEQAPHYGE